MCTLTCPPVTVPLLKAIVFESCEMEREAGTAAGQLINDYRGTIGRQLKNYYTVVEND
jgi:hypothetical protein